MLVARSLRLACDPVIAAKLAEGGQRRAVNTVSKMAQRDVIAIIGTYGKLQLPMQRQPGKSGL